MKRPSFASDKLLARESGPWAKEKLSYLSRYMDILTTGMKARWDRLVFIDLMAGPGMCVDEKAREEFPGSPLLALRTKYPFKAVYLVESHARCHAALTARVAAEGRAHSAVIIHGDANELATIDRLRRECAHSLALAFVDLIGQEVSFETICRLTEDRSVDLLFSFPEMDLKRNTWNVSDIEREAHRWTRFFGTEEYRPIVRSFQPHEAVEHLRALYVRQLESIGYTYHEFAALPMRNSKGRSMYRPLFASKHPKGLSFFRKIAPKRSGGMDNLFD